MESWIVMYVYILRLPICVSEILDDGVDVMKLNYVVALLFWEY